MKKTFDGDLRLPEIISSGMILQRNTPVKIYGWAVPGRAVSVNFNEKRFDAVSDEEGRWSVTLPPMKAGGPYSMSVKSGCCKIDVNDILVGEVWVCSGQSNMQLPIERVKDRYPDDVRYSENSELRQFLVPVTYNFHGPQKDTASGSWKAANPESLLEFSAVGYFFAKALQKKLRVPVGIINASMGGSHVESWMSENSLKAFPEKLGELEECKDDSYVEKTTNDDIERIEKWHEELSGRDEGLCPGKEWYCKDFDAGSWPEMEIPSYWEDEGLDFKRGSVWFQKKVDVPAAMTKVPAKIILGTIVDSDDVYINGHHVGNTEYQYPPRKYEIPAGVLTAGENVITVRVVSDANKGGFIKDKPYQIIAGNRAVDISGKWRYHIGAATEALAQKTFFEWKPCGLYNGMTAPLFNYSVKGVAWYQGESNCDAPEEYGALFRTMIADWRKNWNVAKLPFIYVQLPNLGPASDKPADSDIAVLRQQQLETLSLEDTAMAVTIDVGEWNDLHPLDKKDVGNRLALAAFNTAYGDNTVVPMGPIFRSVSKTDGKLVVSFDNVGSGLAVKGTAPARFEVCGSDGSFVFADAKIDGDNVVVWSDKVENPTAVRYAWADNPEGANLYNMEGLPASPFRAAL